MTEEKRPDENVHGGGRSGPPEPPVDLETTPFRLPSVEGIPFKKGSAEDLAIKRVLRWSEEEREADPHD
jgi:hypothetical protein